MPMGHRMGKGGEGRYNTKSESHSSVLRHAEMYTTPLLDNQGTERPHGQR